jgi:hypothetical protein
VKKLVVLGILLLAVFGLISCPNAALESPYKGYEELEKKTFWARNFSSGKDYSVNAVQLWDGDKCIVWAERSAAVPIETGKKLATEYEKNIRPKIMETFGSEEIMAGGDMDGDGKLTLLLLDIQDGYAGSGAYTAGYFFSNDLFKANASNHSNERDMIYVDTNPSMLLSSASYATIAHELQHFINYNTRIQNKHPAMDTWIDEGLSAAAEYVYLGRQSAERIDHFSRSETIRQGNNFFVWGEKSENILDEYSTVYLFFQWLSIQSGGNEIYKKIIESPDGDYRAVTGVIDGAFAEALESTSWETVLRSWFAANYINSQTTGLYGYHSKIPGLRVYALGGSTQKLLPGEGVYSISGDTPDALPESGGENIKYAGLPKNAGPADLSPDPAVSLDGQYPNGRLLTFNSNARNTNSESAKEIGYLTNGEGENIPPSKGTGRSAWQEGGSWIIDARDLLGRDNENR